jgi:predicted hotdog family 3-hydroxylacyl-ACP dehydratase
LGEEHDAQGTGAFAEALSRQQQERDHSAKAGLLLGTPQWEICARKLKEHRPAFAIAGILELGGEFEALKRARLAPY